MKLAFYKVDNSKRYMRNTFDYHYDNPKKILAMLDELDAEEWRLYDMSSLASLYELTENYNDEELDGGWWCVVIQDYK